MKEYIDEMLHLTADIAEELLTLKDNGNGIGHELARRINRLAEIASANVEESEPQSTSGDDAAPCTVDGAEEGEAIAVAAEFEETEDAEPDEPDEPDIAPEGATCEEAYQQESDFPRVSEATVSMMQPEENQLAAPRCYALTPEELRNAFTINDVFLYQRVLFRGSAKKFAEALDYAANCCDIEEFRHYLAENCRVNLKSAEAKDFIATIRQFL